MVLKLIKKINYRLIVFVFSINIEYKALTQINKKNTDRCREWPCLVLNFPISQGGGLNRGS